MATPKATRQPGPASQRYLDARESVLSSGAAEEGRRWGIYVRISQDAAGEALGVQRQELDCRQLAEDKGGVVVEVFSDNDVSAWSGRRRPGYEAMLQAARDGKITGVIVYNLDRLTRRPIELEEFMELAEKLRLELANVTGEIDLSNHYGQMMARVRGAVARAASDDQSMRIKRKMRELREAGKSTGGGRFYGWTGRCEDPDCTTMHTPLKIVPAEAEVIRECCDRILAGETLNSVHQDLNRRGITTSRGRPWDRKSLRSMIVRARNAGLVETKGTVVAKATDWEPIVTEEVWRSVSNILLDPARIPQNSSNKVKNLLSHIASCGECGSPMIAGVTKWKSGGEMKTAKIYKCRVTGSSHPSRRKEPIDLLVTEAVIARIENSSPDDLLRVHLDDEQRRMEAEAEGLRSQLDEFASLFAEGLIDKQQLITGSGRLRARLEALECLREPVRKEQVLRDFLGETAVREVWEALDIGRQRAVITTLCSSVIINRARRGRVFDPATIDVTWR
jgi:site-specific DNA recombinase